MKIERDVYIGAVTAITYSPNGKYIVYGSGANIYIYDSSTFERIRTIRVLKNALIHGIRFYSNTISVFGQKEFVVLDWCAMEASGFTSCYSLCEQFNFVDWIWDVCVVDEQCSQIAIGTAHNSVVIWSLRENKALRFHYGKERCILYSLSFLNLHGKLLVASGTVFTQVHIWSITNPAHTLVCKAHKGVIFKLRWSADGRYLLSVSDDRALIAWRNSISSTPWSSLEATTVESLLSGSYEPCIHAFGHTARLWDCIFTDDCLITTSEDCTVRFWDASGQCQAVMGGHKGKHVWCIAYHPSTMLALSGGNDGSVKLWDVQGILTTARSASTQTLTIPSMRGEDGDSHAKMKAAPRTSKSECIRDLLVTADGTGVIVASNWGYLWKYDLNRGAWEDLRIPVEYESVSTIALSPDNEIVAQGDCRGNLRVLSVYNRFTAQSIQATDKRVARIHFDGDMLFIVAADNTIVVFILHKLTGKVCRVGEVKPETKGTVTTLLYLQEKNVLCVGDSVGIVHLLRFAPFSSPSSSSSSPSSPIPNQLQVVARTILRRPIGHPTVGCIALHDHRLYVASHDGRIVPYTVDWSTLGFTAEAAIVVPTVKQILSLWWSAQEACCVGGYHESTYHVIDVTHNTEVLSIPAGGWKRPSASYHHPTHPNDGYVLAFAAPAGHSDVTIFRRTSCGTRSVPPALLAPSHGRELNAICWVTAIKEGGLVATGGEDREVQIIAIQRTATEFTWKVLHVLHGHSSCVRVLRSIPLPESQGYLVLSCGGRNEVCIWRLSNDGTQCVLVARLPIPVGKNIHSSKEKECKSETSGEQDGLKKHPLHHTTQETSRKRTSEDMSCDVLPTSTSTSTSTVNDYSEETLQRIMCAALHPISSTMVCLATGDSCGTVQCFIIDLHSLALYTTLTVIAHSTPILSIAIADDLTLLAGTAAGDIASIPATAHILQVVRTQSSHPFPTLDPSTVHLDVGVHLMGVNGLQLIPRGVGTSLCMTVGDDQSFRVSHYHHSTDTLSCERREVYEGVSGTALRSLAVLPSGVYITGWEQRIQRWIEEDNQFVMAGEVATLVPETACVDVIEWDQHVLIAVCGAMGFEVMEIVL